MVRPYEICISLSDALGALMTPQGLTRLQRTLDVNKLEAVLLNRISLKRRMTDPPLAKSYDEAGFCVGLEQLDGIQVPRLPPLADPWLRKVDVRKHMPYLKSMLQCNQMHYVLQQDFGMHVPPPFIITCCKKTGFPRKIIANTRAYFVYQDDNELLLKEIKPDYLKWYRAQKRY